MLCDVVLKHYSLLKFEFNKFKRCKCELEAKSIIGFGVEGHGRRYRRLPLATQYVASEKGLHSKPFKLKQKKCGWDQIAAVE
ncbi:hypothetical protein EVAR_58569_1 [Eumeta japonica]|uniref:Uncharacterized protein n=1 Tax=Eumeta variegata TaxID=151549 RepID=A0A4C1Z2U9_EUMVA|nr:hypothetical protein EVAR_58569_1 [Eumeta japonica]